MLLYLVGGAIRDRLLGRPHRSEDYLYFGSDEDFVRRFPTAKRAGKAFPIFLVGGHEYAPPRAESIEADLLARDLTINALAQQLLDGTPDEKLIAHPKALDDLRDKVLRPAAPEAMRTDPGRVFRAARFAAELPDFTPHPALVEAMRDCASRGLLHDLAAERVAAEMQKALAAPRPSRFFELLAETRCLTPWFAELSPGLHVPAGPPKYHSGSVFAHTMEVIDRLAGDEVTAFMGLAHDLGKGATPNEEWPHHHGHDRRGETLAEALAARLALPNRLRKAGMTAAREHMRAARYGEMRVGTKVDFLAGLGTPQRVRELFALVRADKHERMDDDHESRALADLERILAVSLPPDKRDQGEASGEALRQLRCQALADEETYR